jgi:hypothetical protein
VAAPTKLTSSPAGRRPSGENLRSYETIFAVRVRRRALHGQSDFVGIDVAGWVHRQFRQHDRQPLRLVRKRRCRDWYDNRKRSTWFRSSWGRDDRTSASSPAIANTCWRTPRRSFEVSASPTWCSRCVRREVRLAGSDHEHDLAADVTLLALFVCCGRLLQRQHSFDADPERPLRVLVGDNREDLDSSPS